jgi:hypothetical protein
MSLKWFHVVFITASALLSVVVAMWAFTTGAPVMGILSLAAGGMLVAYQSRFLRKARQIGLK